MKTDQLLKKHNLYATSSRLQVLKQFYKTPSPLTAKELFSALKEEKTDLATIHRILNAFVKHGIVTALSTCGTRKYLLNSPDNHAHVLVCVGCGKDTPFLNPLSESSLKLETKQAITEFGFRVLGHSVVHYGFCSECQDSSDVKVCKHC